MPPAFKRPCVKCGTLTKTGGITNHRGLCPTCRQQYEKQKDADPKRQAKKAHLYGGNYRERAAKIRQQGGACFLCGGVFEPGDTIEAHHLYPSAGHASPLVGTHRECNRKAGNPEQDGATEAGNPPQFVEKINHKK
jgi:5-methylcytosine-specific restriction endonuclease McrA